MMARETFNSKAIFLVVFGMESSGLMGTELQMSDEELICDRSRSVRK